MSAFTQLLSDNPGQDNSHGKVVVHKIVPVGSVTSPYAPSVIFPDGETTG
ncbi:hypothetical protein FXW07_03305 [Methanosarcina sp. DH1]|nr:hypothetical protein [Methanosarcina sp. DH1]MCC4765684.1 hypothetical protein [Methanosarcina sp. DH1]